MSTTKTIRTGFILIQNVFFCFSLMIFSSFIGVKFDTHPVKKCVDLQKIFKEFQNHAKHKCDKVTIV